jgi:hypothetical protein
MKGLVKRKLRTRRQRNAFWQPAHSTIAKLHKSDYHATLEAGFLFCLLAFGCA